MKRMKRRNLSLRYKLILLILVSLLLPGLIASLVSNYLTKDALMETAQKNASGALDLVNLYAENIFVNMIYVITQVQFDDEIGNIIKDIGSSAGAPEPDKLVTDGQKITSKFQAMASTKEKMYITLVLPNGYYFTNYNSSISLSSLMEYSWYNQLKNVQGYDVLWVGSHTNFINPNHPENPYLITIARPLKTSSQIYGYLLVSIDEKEFRRILQDYLPSQEFLLVDAKGNMISSQDQAQIGKPFYFSDLPKDGEAKLVDIFHKNDILMTKRVLYSGWRVVSLTRYEDAVGKVQMIRQTDFLVQLLYILAFSLLLLYLLNQIIKPILKLSRISAKVEDGNLDFRSNVSGNNEIGQLGQSFDRMLDRFQVMIEQIKREQEKKRQAELSMLQAQINPHFLFNILNSIRMKILLKGDEENAELLSSLSTLLRMTINRNDELIPLHEEVNVIKKYVTLLNFRNKETIELKVEIASDTLFEEIPRFIIQPLIENAFIHGLRERGGMILIKSWRENSSVYILVEDNGVGMDPAALHKLWDIKDSLEEDGLKGNEGLSRIGLDNVRERLHILYKDRHRFVIHSELNLGTKVTIQLLGR